MDPIAPQAPASGTPAAEFGPAPNPSAAVPAEASGTAPAEIQQQAAPAAVAPGFDMEAFAQILARTIQPAQQPQQQAPPANPNAAREAFIQRRAAELMPTLGEEGAARQFAEQAWADRQETAKEIRAELSQARAAQMQSEFTQIKAADPRFDPFSGKLDPVSLLAAGIYQSAPKLTPTQHYQIFTQKLAEMGGQQAPAAPAAPAGYGQQYPSRAALFATPGAGAGAPARAPVDSAETEAAIAEGRRRGWIVNDDQEQRIRTRHRAEISGRPTY